MSRNYQPIRIAKGIDLIGSPITPGNELGAPHAATAGPGTGTNPAYLPGTQQQQQQPNTVQTIGGQITGQLRFDQIAALISQGIVAWGRNPSQQVAGLTVQNLQPQQPNYSPYGSGGLTTQQQNYLAAQSNFQQPNTTGGALGSGLDGIVNWATSNPIIVFAGIAGLYLLMREPPRSRR